MGKAKRRADGRIVKTITDPRTGRRIFFYGQTEREVSQKILLFKESMEKGRTFAEVADEWWGDTLERIAVQTRKGYRPAMLRAVESLGDIPVKDIKAKDITRFLNTFKGRFAKKTLANQRMIINLILDVAVIDGDIDANPCASVKTPSTERNIMHAATSEEEKLIKENVDVWLFPFFALMTGMRKGEILALKWEDIDFENNIINVTKSVYHTGNAPGVKEPKTSAGRRIVPLLSALKEKLLEIPDRCPDAFIFSDDGGKTPLRSARFNVLYKQYREKTGLKSSAHQLRHSFATVAFECGVPIKSVQEILGHRQLSTTMDIYTDFRRRSVDDAAEILNKKMGV